MQFQPQPPLVSSQKYRFTTTPKPLPHSLLRCGVGITRKISKLKLSPI
jgi:hypothetical protein